MGNSNPGNTRVAVILGGDLDTESLKDSGLSVTPERASRASVSLQVRWW